MPGVALADAVVPEGLMDGLDVGVVVQDRRSEIKYANRRAVEMLGGQSDQVLGRTSFDPSWDVVRPDGSPFPAAERPVAQALGTGEPQRDVVLGVKTPQGGRSWLLVNANPHVDDDGQVQHVVVTLSDVTSERRRMNLLQQVKDELEQAVGVRTAELARNVEELRRQVEQRQAAEAALAKSEALYGTVLRAMAEGVAIHAPDGAIQYANPMAAKILGLTTAQMTGKEAIDPSWGLLRPDGSPLPPEEIPSEITRRTGAACQRVILGVARGDGDRAWLMVNTDPLEAGDRCGEAPSVVATFTDVTQERETTIALERSREQFERVTRAVPGVLYQALQDTDGEFVLTFVSAAAAEVLGIDADEIIAQPERLLACIDPATREQAVAQALQAQRSGRVYESDVKLSPPGGAPRWIRNRAVPQPVDDGVVWSGVAFDVTEERGLAEQVRAAQRREAIGTVTAGIAHNFNNALAVLVPNLEECLATADASTRRPLLESLQTARSAAELVRQLMFIARSGLADEHASVDLAALVGETAAMLERLLRGRVDVRVRNVERGVRVASSPSALHQVLLNLCINAEDALRGVDGGFVELSLDVEERTGADSTAVLRVRDNGCGMSEKTRRRLGEPFFTTKPAGAGTGLGLATAYATVQELGGEIHCTSAPGEGTEFMVTLPVADFGTPPEPPRETKLNVAEQGEATVLVVDDEPLVRSALALALRRRGHRVEQASTGREGLALVEAGASSYDAVILDLSMPGLSGETVLAKLRRDAPDLPVIVLSGFVEDPDALCHAAVVLNKPVSTAGINDAVARVLQGPHAR